MLPGAHSRDDLTFEQVRSHDDDVYTSWEERSAVGGAVCHLHGLTLKHATRVADTLRRLNGRIFRVLGNRTAVDTPILGKLFERWSAQARYLAITAVLSRLLCVAALLARERRLSPAP